VNNATKPWGAQWNYITKVEKGSWYGHWIAYNAKLKNQKRVIWAEQTANDADLVVFYIHG
jgi:hypothetical protein